MSTRASGTRYARALFDVALAQGSVEQAEQDLSRFVGLMQQHADLHLALTSPAIPAVRKRALVEDLLPRLGPVNPTVAKLLLLIADRDRMAILPDLLDVYRDRLRTHQGIVEADITTATPLSDASTSALRDRLATITGQQVRLTTNVDPALIGGMVARLGTIVYDGSIVAQLQKMKQRLTEQR